MSSPRGDDFTNSDSHGMGGTVPRVDVAPIDIGEQIETFINSLLIIEGLVMRKGY